MATAESKFQSCGKVKDRGKSDFERVLLHASYVTQESRVLREVGSSRLRWSELGGSCYYEGASTVQGGDGGRETDGSRLG